MSAESRIVVLARQVVGRHTDESVGQVGAIAAAVIAVVAGPLVFRAPGIPLTGQVSMATVTSVLCVVLGGVAFATAYVRVAGLSSYWRARPLVWRIRDTAGLTLASVSVAVMAVVAAYSTFQRAFRGLVVGRISATLLLAVVVGVCCYTLSVIGHQMSSSRVAVLLGSFLGAGVFASMLTADDPGWWQSNFSALGISTSSSASAFNFTVVIAGIVLTTLADYVASDLTRWPGVTQRVDRLVRGVLVLIGVALVGLGVVPVNLSRVGHDIFAFTALIAFGLLILTAPVLLKGLPSPFIVTTGLFGGLMLVIVLLWAPGGRYNLTAVELLSVLIIFAWLALFARTVSSGPVQISSAGPEPVVVDQVVTEDPPPLVQPAARPAHTRASWGAILLALAAGAALGAVVTRRAGQPGVSGRR